MLGDVRLKQLDDRAGMASRSEHRGERESMDFRPTPGVGDLEDRDATSGSVRSVRRPGRNWISSQAGFRSIAGRFATFAGSSGRRR
jgi:hypothetical protein